MEFPTVRPYRPEDRAALHDICVRTGWNGADATAHYRDPEIVPLVFAAPYAELEPELVFVVDDGQRAVGYVVGTADTTAFVAAYRVSWLPQVRDRFPEPREPLDGNDDAMRQLLHHPEHMVRPGLTDYPAHLHIDLLPPFQRRGFGRRLMHAFWDALRAAGVPGVHLAVSPANTSAQAFYGRLGYQRLQVPGASSAVDYLGYRL